MGRSLSLEVFGPQPMTSGAAAIGAWWRQSCSSQYGQLQSPGVLCISASVHIVQPSQQISAERSDWRRR